MTDTRGDIRLSSRDRAQRCSVCHGDLVERSGGPEAAGEADELWSCEACATVLHADCRAELRGCPTLGCGGGATESEGSPPAAEGARDGLTALRLLLRRGAGFLCLLISVLGTAAVTFVLGIVVCMIFALVASGEAIRGEELFTLLLSATVLGSLGMATRSGFREMGENLLGRRPAPAPEPDEPGERS